MAGVAVLLAVVDLLHGVSGIAFRAEGGVSSSLSDESLLSLDPSLDSLLDVLRVLGVVAGDFVGVVGVLLAVDAALIFGMVTGVGVVGAVLSSLSEEAVELSLDSLLDAAAGLALYVVESGFAKVAVVGVLLAVDVDVALLGGVTGVTFDAEDGFSSSLSDETLLSLELSLELPLAVAAGVLDAVVAGGLAWAGVAASTGVARVPFVLDVGVGFCCFTGVCFVYGDR